jgi:hypothetical protein
MVTGPRNVLSEYVILCAEYWKSSRHELTVSEPAAVTSSCKARTDKACSITNTHCDRSGGMFWNMEDNQISLSL